MLSDPSIPTLAAPHSPVAIVGCMIIRNLLSEFANGQFFIFMLYVRPFSPTFIINQIKYPIQFTYWGGQNPEITLLGNIKGVIRESNCGSIRKCSNIDLNKSKNNETATKRGRGAIQRIQTQQHRSVMWKYNKKMLQKNRLVIRSH